MVDVVTKNIPVRPELKNGTLKIVSLNLYTKIWPREGLICYLQICYLKN